MLVEKKTNTRYNEKFRVTYHRRNEPQEAAEL